MAKNLISSRFQIGEKPLIANRSKFPYNDVITSLKNLDKTKAIIFTEKEINYGNITMLKKLVTKYKLGFLRNAKQHGHTYVWLNNEVREEA